MTDKEQEILSLYLKDLRKKRIIIVLIVAYIIIIGGASIRKYVLSNNENVMLNENVTKENTTNEIEDTIKTENIIEKTEESENKKQEKIEETKEKISTEVQKPKIEKESNKENNSNNKQEEQKTEKTTSKPSNKDFLFTDGYTMENVTQAAQDYLTSSGYAGECVPIQDNEGVYLGMRVTFY